MKKIASALQLEPDDITLDSDFRGLAEFDSLGMFELLLVIEDLGVELTDEDVGGARTMMDVYRMYVEHLVLEGT